VAPAWLPTWLPLDGYFIDVFLCATAILHWQLLDNTAQVRIEGREDKFARAKKCRGRGEPIGLFDVYNYLVDRHKRVYYYYYLVRKSESHTHDGAQTVISRHL
jgi:hypothetical protein